MWVLEQGVSKYKNGYEKKYWSCEIKRLVLGSELSPWAGETLQGLPLLLVSVQPLIHYVPLGTSQISSSLFPHLQLLKTMVGSCEDQI